MDVLEIAKIIDGTSVSVVLFVLMWRLLSQVDRVIEATSDVINRLIDILETDDDDTDKPTPLPPNSHS